MLAQLRLVDFRCYRNFRWEIPPSGAIIVGNNAGGKTSILEAICFLLRLQSPRTSKPANLIRHETPRFGIKAGILNQTRRIVWDGKMNDLQVDGEPRTDQKSYLMDSFPVVWLGNSDLDLVRAGADSRRKYLDFLGSQWHPVYRNELIRYNRALKSRNLLLKKNSPDRRQLDAYTQALALHGTKLIAIRRELITILTPHAIQSFLSIGKSEEAFTLDYLPSVENDLEQALNADLNKDIRYGQTQSGPHRDDIALLIDGKPSAQFASEGQQRTIAIALKMAQSSLLREETGHAPIHLIDDVFGELDPARRTALLQALPTDSQSIITTTHLDWMPESVTTLPVFELEKRTLHLR